MIQEVTKYRVTTGQEYLTLETAQSAELENLVRQSKNLSNWQAIIQFLISIPFSRGGSLTLTQLARFLVRGGHYTKEQIQEQVNQLQEALTEDRV